MHWFVACALRHDAYNRLYSRELVRSSANVAAINIHKQLHTFGDCIDASRRYPSSAKNKGDRVILHPISSFAPAKTKAGFSKRTHEWAKLHLWGLRNWASREMHVLHLQLHNTRGWQKCQRLLDAERTRLREEHNFKIQVLFLHFRL